jgi:hypothetical protein
MIINHINNQYLIKKYGKLIYYHIKNIHGYFQQIKIIIKVILKIGDLDDDDDLYIID